MTTKNDLAVASDEALPTEKKSEARSNSPGEIVRAIFRWEASGVLVALIVLCVILAVSSPNFLTPFNLTVVIREASFVGLVALYTHSTPASRRDPPLRGRSRLPLLHRWMSDVKGFGIASLARHPGNGRVRSGHPGPSVVFLSPSAN